MFFKFYEIKNYFLVTRKIYIASNLFTGYRLWRLIAWRGRILGGRGTGNRCDVLTGVRCRTGPAVSSVQLVEQGSSASMLGLLLGAARSRGSHIRYRDLQKLRVMSDFYQGSSEGYRFSVFFFHSVMIWSTVITLIIAALHLIGLSINDVKLILSM